MSPLYELQPVDPLLVGDLIVRISFRRTRAVPRRNTASWCPHSEFR